MVCTKSETGRILTKGMSSDIVEHLLLDNDFSTSRTIAVKEINGCDSSFITSCVLGHCIKNKHAVLLITTHNSVSHYQNVGQKFNYNLQKHLDSSLIAVYNLNNEFLNNILEGNRNKINNIISNIESKLSAMKEKNERVSIIIDGVSHLLDMQYSLRETNEFCKSVVDLLKGESNCFALFHCNVAVAEDVTWVLANLLCHKAYTVLDVETLPSGWSADVSGHLVVKHPGRMFDEDNLYTMALKQSRYLFKLFDRGVKLFAPGTV